MKRILRKFFKVVAVIVLIPGILVWISGIGVFLFRLFVLYKTGQWNKLAFSEFIPNHFITEFSIKYAKINKAIDWVLNREFILILFGDGLILIFIFLIMKALARQWEEKPKIAAYRLEKIFTLRNYTDIVRSSDWSSTEFVI